MIGIEYMVDTINNNRLEDESNEIRADKQFQKVYSSELLYTQKTTSTDWGTC